ncbi:MAG: efflux RND transporter periplasmic adaptor subunit [Opitutus sp.]|nr:efflux RND transporter periplasmic adaptor subunit [Opitutus sp.]
MKSSLVVSLLLVFVAGCARPETAGTAAATLPPARVHVAVVQIENLLQLTDVTGTIRPRQRAVLAAKMMGAIAELPVTLGKRVQAGDVLVKLFSADVAARLTQTRAQLNVARRDLDRERELLAQGASTAELVRNLQDRFTGVEAAVRDAEVQLGYTEIRAPFDGVIARKMVQAGDLAAPGQPLLEVEGTVDFEVEAGIPDSFAAALTAGAALECEAGGITFTGSLREISSTSDATTRSIGVKIAVPAGVAVRSGQFTRVQVPGAAVRTLLVPTAAVSASGQMERVFVLGEGNRAVLRLVKTGATRGGRVEILSGLAAGDRIVIAPPAGLRDGQPLEALP